MVISRFADGFKITQSHVAWIAFGHGTIGASDDDVSTAEFLNGLNAIQAGTRAREGVRPCSVSVDPSEEEINSKGGVVA